MATIDGGHKIRMKLELHIAGRRAQIEKGLEEAAAMVLDKSLDECPIEPGSEELWESGSARLEGSGTPISAGVVAYGTNHAVPVHQRPPNVVAHGEAYNQKHAAEIAAGRMTPRRVGEKWKFLSDPVEESMDEIKRIINEALGVSS